MTAPDVVTDDSRWRLQMIALGVAIFVILLVLAMGAGVALRGAAVDHADTPPPEPESALAPVVAVAASPSPAPTTEPAPTETAAPTVMSASAPVTVSLPSIGVESAVMDLGLDADGALEVPPTAYPAGWYTGAPTPGELGPAIIAGHVDYRGEVGVFHDLHRMVVGDEVHVERADGTTAVFVVTDVQQHAKAEFPTDAVYGDIDHAGLRLITCGGDYDRDARSHVDNIVVFAELAGDPA